MTSVSNSGPAQLTHKEVAARWRLLGDEQKEKHLSDGLATIYADPRRNVSAAAVKHSIPYTTLYNRYLGKTKARKLAHGDQQSVSPQMEDALVKWCMLLSDRAEPLSKRQIKLKARIMCGHRLGKNWTRRFLARHPEIKLGRPSGLDHKRARAFNKPVVYRYFDKLEGTVEFNGKLVKISDIPAKNRYNYDEKGIQRGTAKRRSRQKYIVPRNRRPKYKKQSANLELITIMECVSADGVALDPGFIFPGKTFDPAWFDRDQSEYPDVW